MATYVQVTNHSGFSAERQGISFKAPGTVTITSNHVVITITAYHGQSVSTIMLNRWQHGTLRDDLNGGPEIARGLFKVDSKDLDSLDLICWRRLSRLPEAGYQYNTSYDSDLDYKRDKFNIPLKKNQIFTFNPFPYSLPELTMAWKLVNE